jgi:pimeloyl-ACP methyl ester carboxylesterase
MKSYDYNLWSMQCVVEHLRECGTTSTIALWGRSMGAATALLHGERDPSIAGMILDSAFTDLESLAEELVDRGRQHGLYAPGFVVSIAIRFIRSSVQKSAGFDIKDLSPIAHADRCYIPALFIAAEGDNFVPPHHSKRLYEKYAGDKNLILVDGDHNSLRPRFMQDSVTIFLHNVLQVGRLSTSSTATLSADVPTSLPTDPRGLDSRVRIEVGRLSALEQ